MPCRSDLFRQGKPYPTDFAAFPATGTPIMLKLPEPRFTVRRLMVVVAVLALGYSLVNWFVLHQKFQMTAIIHDEKQKTMALELNNLERFPPEYAPSSVSPRKRLELMALDQLRVARWRRQIDYHAKMKEKYDRAASHPWNSLTPDPPEPN